MHMLTLCFALEPSQAGEFFATLGEATGVQGDGSNLNVVVDLKDHYCHGQPQKFKISQYFFLNLVMRGLGGEEGWERDIGVEKDWMFQESTRIYGTWNICTQILLIRLYALGRTNSLILSGCGIFWDFWCGVGSTSSFPGRKKEHTKDNLETWQSQLAITAWQIEMLSRDMTPDIFVCLLQLLTCMYIFFHLRQRNTSGVLLPVPAIVFFNSDVHKQLVSREGSQHWKNQQPYLKLPFACEHIQQRHKDEGSLLSRVSLLSHWLGGGTAERCCSPRCAQLHLESKTLLS